MNEIELAQLFVEYAECNKKKEELETKISEAILERGESMKMAGVQASYYKPSYETPNYEYFAKLSLPKDFDLSPYSTTKTTIKWKEVCEDMGISTPPGMEIPAKVIVKMK